MSPLQSKLAWGGALGVTLCLGVVLLSTGNAQPARQVNVESLLPEDAVVYVGWDGQEAHAKAWEETAAYQSLHESGLMELVNKVIVWAGEQAEAQGKQAEFADFKALWEKVHGQGASLAISVNPESNPPEVHSVLVLHNGAELEKVFNKYLKDNPNLGVEVKTTEMQGRKVTHTELPEVPNGEIGWWQEGQHLVICFGMNAIEPTLAIATGKAGNITGNATYKKYATTEGFERNAVAWVNFGALREMFGGMPIPAGPERRLAVNDILKVLGLDTIGALVVESGYKGKSIWSQTTLEAPGDRQGLLGLLEQKPLQWDQLPPLPSSTSGFSIASVNWSQFYEDMLKTARSGAEMGPPEASQQLENALNQAPEFLGFDPKKGLFDSLGDVTCLYGDDGQGFFGFSFGLAVQVKDEKRLDATLKLLLAKVASEAPPEQVLVRTTKKHGKDIVTLEIGGGFFNPSYVVSDGWLVIGLVPQVPEAFVLRQQKKLPAWQPDEAFQAAMKELPAEYTTLTVSDPRKIYQLMLGLAPYAIGGLRAMAMQGGGVDLPIAVADLPPTELVTRPLYLNIAVSTADAETVRWISRNSAPAIPLVGNMSSASTIPVLVALLLPAVQQAREAARRTQSKNNLKQLGLALHNYHDTYNKFPEGAWPNEDLKLDQRLSWLSRVLPFIDEAPLYNEMDFEKAWNDEDNEEAAKTSLMVLLNPGLNATSTTGYGQTHYVGIAGLGKEGPTLPANHPKAGFFGYNRATGIRNITDGTSNTFMVAETTQQGAGNWAQGTQTIKPFTTKPYINGPDGIGGPFRGGCHFLMADGSVRFVSENIDPATLEALTTICGGEVIGEF